MFRETSEKELNSHFILCSDHIEKIEFKNMLSNEGDEMSVVIQITAGAGGTESCDWAYMLMRMYIMWAEKNNYKLKELDLQQGDVTGIKSVTLEIDGEYGFGWLKGEMEFIDWLGFPLLTVMQKDIRLLLLCMLILL